MNGLCNTHHLYDEKEDNNSDFSSPESVYYYDDIGNRLGIDHGNNSKYDDSGDEEYFYTDTYNKMQLVKIEDGFTGKQRDSATGLAYFNARYYDPAIGRFITVDPIKSGVNWYVYCGNNPLKYVDPDGLVEIEILLGLDPDPFNSFKATRERLAKAIGFSDSGVAWSIVKLATGLSISVTDAVEKDFKDAYQNDETKYIVIFAHGRGWEAWVGDAVGPTTTEDGLAIVDPGMIADLDTFNGLERGDNLLAIFLITCHQGKFKEDWEKAAGVEVVTYYGEQGNLLLSFNEFNFVVPREIIERESKYDEWDHYNENLPDDANI